MCLSLPTLNVSKMCGFEVQLESTMMQAHTHLNHMQFSTSRKGMNRRDKRIISMWTSGLTCGLDGGVARADPPPRAPGVAVASEPTEELLHGVSGHLKNNRIKYIRV